MLGGRLARREPRPLFQICLDTFIRKLLDYGEDHGHAIEFAIIADGAPFSQSLLIHILDKEHFPLDPDLVETATWGRDPSNQNDPGVRFDVVGYIHDQNVHWKCSQERVTSFFSSDGRKFADELLVRDVVREKKEDAWTALLEEALAKRREKKAAKKAAQRLRKREIAEKSKANPDRTEVVIIDANGIVRLSRTNGRQLGARKGLDIHFGSLTSTDAVTTGDAQPLLSTRNGPKRTRGRTLGGARRSAKSLWQDPCGIPSGESPARRQPAMSGGALQPVSDTRVLQLQFGNLGTDAAGVEGDSQPEESSHCQKQAEHQQRRRDKLTAKKKRQKDRRGKETAEAARAAEEAEQKKQILLQDAIAYGKELFRAPGRRGDVQVVDPSTEEGRAALAEAQQQGLEIFTFQHIKGTGPEASGSGAKSESAEPT